MFKRILIDWMLYNYRISNVYLKNKNGKWLKMIYVYYVTCATIFF